MSLTEALNYTCYTEKDLSKMSFKDLEETIDFCEKALEFFKGKNFLTRGDEVFYSKKCEAYKTIRDYLKGGV